MDAMESDDPQTTVDVREVSHRRRDVDAGSLEHPEKSV